MKGYAVTKSLEKMGWIEKDVPKLESIDALLKPIALTPCTSDVHNFETSTKLEGIILGHEALGEIVEVGADVKDFKPGDKVMVPATTPDWRSIRAQQKIPQHSNRALGGFIFGTEELDGVFAEYFRVRDADMNLYKIPDGLDYKQALMLVDMASTGFYGSEMAEIEFGDTVVVIGIGPVGLMSVVGSVLSGAGRVIGVGSRPACTALAKEFGASDVVNYKDGDLVKQIKELMGGEPVDRCIIAGGDPDVMAKAVKLIRNGGNVMNLNYFTTFDPLPIPNPSWGFGMGDKKINGGLCPGGRVRMEALASMVLHGRFDPSKMITHEYHGFDKIPEAFDMMVKKPPELVKTIVYC